MSYISLVNKGNQMKKKMYSFRININLLEDLQLYSLLNNTNTSDVIRTAVSLYLEKINK